MRRALYRNALAKRIRTEGRDVSAAELIESFQRSALRRLQPITVDRVYRVPTLETARLLIERSKLDGRKYVSERFDCDDFALAFKAELALDFRLNSVGLVCDYSGGHAYTAMPTHKGGALAWAIVEPQNDRIISAGDSFSPSESYRLQSGFVLL